MNKKKIFATLLSAFLIFSAAPVASTSTVTSKPITEVAAATDPLDMQVKDLKTGTLKTIPKSQYTSSTNLTKQSTSSYIPAGVKNTLRGKVIGSDDRNKITNTKVFPYSAICYIRIVYPNNKAYIGTAWMYSKNTAITAGHCVYSKDNGGWAKSITVYPGANGSATPFGSTTAKAIHAPSEYVSKQSSNYDFGVIQLNSDIGNTVGYFGASWTSSSLKGKKVTVTGYPGEKSKTQWTMSGPISSVTANRLIYKMDTTGGQSGCPVYVKESNNYRAVSIHTTGSTNSNGSTRITKPLYDYMNRFR